MNMLAHTKHAAGRRPHALLKALSRVRRNREGRIGVAEEVWVAAALLHEENPRRKDFTIDEIIGRVRREAGRRKLRASVYAHVVQHCVANKPPSPSRLRYLVETRPGYRKLFRRGHGWHFYRDRGRKVPRAEALPPEYRYLLRWYVETYDVMTSKRAEKDSILALRGLGKEIWAGVDPDEYVRQHREGWQ
jgi:hypothetical protein